MFYFIAILTICIVVAYLYISRKKSKSNRANSVVYLIGEKNSGKTALLYYLSNRNNSIKTTNSIEPNETTLQLQNQSVPVIDVPGNNYYQEQFLMKIDEAHKIVLVVDAASLQSIAPTAEYIYNILTSSKYQRSKKAILIVLNKQDQPKAIKQHDFESFISKQIEKIKKSRRAISEQKDSVSDKLKHQEQQFQLSDYPLIKIVETSVYTEEVKDVEKFIFGQ